MGIAQLGGQIIFSCHFAKRNGSPFPTVEGDYNHGEVNKVYFNEMRPRFGKHVVRHLSDADEGECIYPRQGDASMVGEKSSRCIPASPAT